MVTTSTTSLASLASTTSLAVLGTGLMGAPMTRRAAAAGLTVSAWNRTRSKAAPLAADGVRIADSPADAARGADAVLTMLTDADAVAAAMTGPDGALAAMSERALWLQTSTVGVEGSARLAALAADRDVVYVDAPVLGTTGPAERGALVVLGSGPEDARGAARPVFEAIGSRTLWLGPAGAGSRLKLVVNAWVLALDTAAAESIALARALGLDPAVFLETIGGGPTDSPYAHLKGDAILSGNYQPNFPVNGAAKDAGLIVAAATQAGLTLEVAAAVYRQMQRAVDLGHGSEDMAAVYFAATAKIT